MTSVHRTADSAAIGSPPSSYWSIPTPALIVDRAILSANIDGGRVTRAARYGMVLRPHAKTHKSAEIARQQLAAGAVGITVATIAEAEMMANAGVRDLLLAYPPVDPWLSAKSSRSLERLVYEWGSTMSTPSCGSTVHARSPTAWISAFSGK